MIYFVRHGATDWNEFVDENGKHNPKLQGRADIPLNEKGIAQAYETAKFLAGKHFDRVICSPLLRAKQTCEIVCGKDTGIEYDDRLMERDFGEFEGVCKSEMNFGEFWSLTLNKQYKKAESAVAFKNRILGFLEELKADKDKEILIVAHGGVGCSMLGYFEGFSPDGNLLGPVIQNGKVLVFDYDKISK